MQIKTVLSKHEPFASIMNRVTQKNSRTRYHLNLPYDIDYVDNQDDPQAANAYASKADRGAGGRPKQTPMSVIAVDLREKIQQLLSSGNSNYNYNYNNKGQVKLDHDKHDYEEQVEMTFKLGYVVIYSFVQLYNKYVSDDSEFTINIKSKTRKILETMYDAQMFRMMITSSTKTNGGHGVEINRRKSNNNLNSKLTAYINNQLQIENTQTQTTATAAQNAIAIATQTNTKMNNNIINDDDNDGEYNPSLRQDVDSRLKTIGSEFDQVTFWDRLNLKFTSLASKGFQESMNKQQTEFESMNNLIKYEFTKYMKMLSMPIANVNINYNINGSNQDPNDKSKSKSSSSNNNKNNSNSNKNNINGLEWLLEQLIETMESAVREISVLMHASFARFRLNTRLYEKVVKLAQESQ